MSKYIKLGDALIICQPLSNYEIAIKEVLELLPTIEVSEDCIDREGVYRAIITCGEVDNDLNHLYEVIENEPSVIPQPKEGEWVEVDDSVQPICSKCGMACSGIHRNADYSVVPTWKYCPNCGAKMKGAER